MATARGTIDSSTHSTPIIAAPGAGKKIVYDGRFHVQAIEAGGTTPTLKSGSNEIEFVRCANDGDGLRLEHYYNDEAGANEAQYLNCTNGTDVKYTIDYRIVGA